MNTRLVVFPGNGGIYRRCDPWPSQVAVSPLHTHEFGHGVFLSDISQFPLNVKTISISTDVFLAILNWTRFLNIMLSECQIYKTNFNRKYFRNRCLIMRILPANAEVLPLPVLILSQKHCVMEFYFLSLLLIPHSHARIKGSRKFKFI